MLILYSATLLKSFVSVSSFSVNCIGFSVQKPTSSADRESFTSLFPSAVLYFLALVASSRTSRPVLSRSGKSGHPCVPPDTELNPSSLPPGSVMLVGFSYMPLEDFFSSQFVECFNESVQFSSVAQSCLTLFDPMDCSTPGFSVHHKLPELSQTHVH